MRRSVACVLFSLISVGSVSSASAQQALNVDIVERLGLVTLERDTIGCFDVLAAMRLQNEIAGGAFSDETRNAFASGSCVVAASQGSMTDVQSIVINDAALMRGTDAASNVLMYFPDASFNSEFTQTSGASLAAVAADLRVRVTARENCAAARNDLDARILDFNARVEAYLAVQSEDTVETGSRLKGNDSMTVSSVRFAGAANDALREESEALKAEAAAHEERCGAYREGLVLDQDYMTYHRATREPNS